MYYCIRAGKLEAAIRFANDNNITPELISVLVALERQQAEAAQDSIKAVRGLFGQREGSIDPFEKAVLNLLGYVNVVKIDKNHVVRTTEDYLWWSLWFCAEGNPANSSLAPHGPSAAGRFRIEVGK